MIRAFTKFHDTGGASATVLLTILGSAESYLWIIRRLVMQLHCCILDARETASNGESALVQLAI
jgi:hypothetical protein